MTLTAPRPTAGATSARWKAVLPGLWVGTVNGEFAGMIEEIPGGRYSASTRLGKNLGIFATFDTAKASLRD